MVGRLLGLVLSAGLAASAAHAQTFPNRPVNLIVPWPAGGTTDVVMRALATATEKHLGQSLVIENRGGASGTLGPAHMAANAKPDGYTVAQIPITVFRLPHMRKTTFDPAKDFTYIIGLTGYTFGVVVRKDAPWKTFQELLADAKANPTKINYGTPGAGTSLHITMEQIAKHQGLKWTHVPFKGNAEATTALLGGHIQVLADLDRLGAARQQRRAAPARHLGRRPHQELAERAELEGGRHRHRVQFAVRDRRSSRHGSGGRQGRCTTPSRKAWKTPPTSPRWRSSTRSRST